MAARVVMPTFGMTEGEATIVRWLKAVGDTVKVDEPLVEAETDKALLEVPSPAEGVVLRLDVEAGQAAPYRSVIAWIGQAGEAITNAEGTEQTAGAQTKQDRPSLRESEGDEDSAWVKASPLARRKAREHGVNLRQVQGSGFAGRVVEEDVLRALSAKQTAEGTEVPAAGIAPAGARPPVPERSLDSDHKATTAGFEVVPQTTVRRVTAARMSESFRTAPHFYLQMEVRAARLVALREELLSDIEQRTGLRLSYTDLLLRGLALLLPRHPLLNAAWHDGEVRTYSEVHLAVAVSAPQGLLVPVIHRAEQLTLSELLRQRDSLARQARAGVLNPGDLSGATFTLTNLGMYGVDAFIPILNPPQSAILAAGAIAERPVGVAGQVVLQPTLNLTLAVDHRVADGAQAAEFVQDLRALLEAPARMLL